MEIGLADLVRIFRRHFLMILSLTVVIVSATVLISFFVLKPEFEATSTLLVGVNTMGTRFPMTA